MQSTELGMGSSSGFYTSGGAPANSWPLSNGYEPKTEKGVPSTSVINQGTNDMNRCAFSKTPPLTVTYCAPHLGLIAIQLYIPGNQFWTLQFHEGGFYLIAAALLAALSLFAVRKVKA
jgi:hypothetical protein